MLLSQTRLLGPEGLEELLEFGAHVLIVDRRRCQYSKGLMEELTRAIPMSETPEIIYTIDLGRTPKEEWEGTWVPGVPCLISEGSLYLGVDAFKKVREMVRSMEGAKIQAYT